MARISYKKFFLFLLLGNLFLFSFHDAKSNFNKNSLVLEFQECISSNPTFIDLRDKYEGYVQIIEDSTCYSYIYTGYSMIYEKAHYQNELFNEKVLAPVNQHLVDPIKTSVYEAWKSNYQKFIKPVLIWVVNHYEKYLSRHVDIAKSYLDDLYLILSPHVRKYSKIAAAQSKSSLTKIYEKVSYNWNLYVAPYLRFVKYYVLEKFWRAFINLRISYYVSLLPTFKRSIYHFNHVLIPSYYNKMRTQVTHNLIPSIQGKFYELVESFQTYFKNLFTVYIYPRVLYYARLIETPVNYYAGLAVQKVLLFFQKIVIPLGVKSLFALKSLVSKIIFGYLKPALQCICENVQSLFGPYYLNDRGENLIVEFFLQIYYGFINAYNGVVGKYYEFLTSDPLDEEIDRLSALLTKYAMSTYAAGLGTATAFSFATSEPYTTSSSLDSLETAKFLKSDLDSSLTPVEKQIQTWQEVVSSTFDSVIEDFQGEFLKFEENYVQENFKPLLESNLRNLNDYINKGYMKIQKSIREIDSADIFLNKENFIINADSLKEPKSKSQNEDLKYFKTEYPDDAIDSYGLNYDNYLELIDEISYMNDLGYNNSLLYKAKNDPDFEDREFFLEYVIAGVDIEASFGEVYGLEDEHNVNKFTLLSPGEYIITSSLLKRITLSNNNRNVIKKVDRKTVREQFSEARGGIEQKGEIMKSVIENGFYEILEEFNNLKFRNLEIFEEFSDILLDEWDKKFVEYLERDSTASSDDDGSFLFDIDSIIEPAAEGTQDSQEIVNFYESKKDLYESELEKKKQKKIKIHHAKNWKNFKEFYKIKETLSETRNKLNEYQPNLQPAHDIASQIDKVVGILMSESNQYLDILRAQANLAFQFREEFEKNERIRRYYKFNGYPTLSEEEIRQEKERQKKLIEDKESINESVKKSEEERRRMLTVLLDGKPDDEEYIQAKLSRPKDPEEIISELESDNIEYYYDDDGYYYDGFEIYDAPEQIVTKFIVVNDEDGSEHTSTESVTFATTETPEAEAQAETNFESEVSISNIEDLSQTIEPEKEQEDSEAIGDLLKEEEPSQAVSEFDETVSETVDGTHESEESQKTVTSPLENSSEAVTIGGYQASAAVERIENNADENTELGTDTTSFESESAGNHTHSKLGIASEDLDLDISIESTEVPAVSTEVPTESMKVPIESTEIPNESTEAPTEAVQIAAKSTKISTKSFDTNEENSKSLD
ncbi:She10 protein [Saccharomycopsis crataegensis]|uniref:She10 protein n=1 Tax=Saccharomycopsis crataegensis TaxID=43959 RepID=A0AAV5QKM0_9ASCO|nr:She10 protein [Saccharomycopsis crataegensis]